MARWMRTLQILNSIGIILFVCVLSIAATAKAQPILRFVQLADSGGGLSYELNTLVLGGSVQLTAPDGTVIASGNSTLSGLSYAELEQRFFGEWAIDDTFPSPPGPVIETHYFTLSALPVLPVPTLTTPADGATVGTTFDLAWTYPPGEQMPSNAVRSQSFATLNFDFTGENQATATLSPLGQPPGIATIRVGGSSDLSPYLSPITPSNPPFDPYMLVGTYATLSAPVSITIVPEPSSCVLAGIAGIAALAVARRHHADRHQRRSATVSDPRERTSKAAASI